MNGEHTETLFQRFGRYYMFCRFNDVWGNTSRWRAFKFAIWMTRGYLRRDMK